MAEDNEQHAAAFHALQQQQVTGGNSLPAPTSTVSATGGGGLRGPFRGKCLYKTGKCANERALKTSGAAHNLCDEHRRRQNEHQRKLDSKNRFSRKTKPSVLDKVSPASIAPAGSAGGDAVDNESSAKSRYSPHEKKSSRARHDESSVDETPAAAAALPAAMKGPGPGDAQITPVMMQAAGSAHSLPVAGVVAHAALPTALPSQAPPVSSALQPPQMPYPYMQDFDGLVVPLPSYLEGHERIEFRARIYQKVLDFISEECIRRFSGKMISDGLAQQQQLLLLQQQQQAQPPRAAHAEVSPAGYFSPQPAQPAVVHYQSVATPQQQQQQVAPPNATSTPIKSPSTSTLDREKRGRAKPQAEVVVQHEAEANNEATDDSEEEPLPPPAKKHSRSGGGRSSRDRPSKLNTRSEV
ncbi:12-oxophytodienoate reductase [Globisporangium polare]